MFVAQTSVYLVGRFTITHGFAETVLMSTLRLGRGPGRPAADSTDSGGGVQSVCTNQRSAGDLHCFADWLAHRLALTWAGSSRRRSALRGRSVARPGRGRRGRLRLARTPRRGCRDQIYRRRVGGAAPAGEFVPGGGFSGGDIDLREIALPVPRLVMPTGGSW